MFMYEGPTADELCSVGWYIHVCMFLIFNDFGTLLYIPVPSLNKDFIIIIIIEKPSFVISLFIASNIVYINISKCYTNIHSLYKQLTKMGLTNLHLFCFYTLLHYTSNTSLDSSHTSTNSSHTSTDTMLYSNWMLNNQ